MYISPGHKTFSSWQRVGFLQKAIEGVAVNVQSSFAGFDVFFIMEEDIARLRAGIAVNIVSIREGVDGTEMVEPVGRAFMSRSGKALQIKTPHLAGGEASVSWSRFLQVLEGSLKRANLSIPAQAASSERSVGTISFFGS